MCAFRSWLSPGSASVVLVFLSSVFLLFPALRVHGSGSDMSIIYSAIFVQIVCYLFVVGTRVLALLKFDLDGYVCWYVSSLH